MGQKGLYKFNTQCFQNIEICISKTYLQNTEICCGTKTLKARLHEL